MNYEGIVRKKNTYMEISNLIERLCILIVTCIMKIVKNALFKQYNNWLILN